MYSFYVDGKELSKEDARHAFKVLRLRAGDQICALDGIKRRLARIEEVSADRVLLEMGEELPDNEPRVRLTIYQGFPKADKLELIVQKLTELGCTRFVPVIMERSVAKPQTVEQRLERLNRISREAVKQCGRARPLEILSPVSWGAALEDMKKRELMLAPWEETHAGRIINEHDKYPGAMDIGILIGPEGGITQCEMDDIMALGGHAVTLGKRIMRTETAAIAAAAISLELWDS